MGAKKQMKEYEESKKLYVRANFVDGKMDLEMNVGFSEILALAMSLLEVSSDKDELITQIALAGFVKDRMEKKNKK